MLLVGTGGVHAFAPPAYQTIFDTEVVNFESRNLTCPKPEPYPNEVVGAVGFYLDNVGPLICGGFDMFEERVDSECRRYSAQKREWEVRTSREFHTNKKPQYLVKCCPNILLNLVLA